MIRNESASARPAASVLIDSLIGYYALEPAVVELHRRGCQLHLFAPRRIRARLEPLLAQAGLAGYPLGDLADDAPFTKRLHRLLRQLFTRPSYSFQYRLLAHPGNYGGGFAYRLASLVARLSPGLSHDRVNRAMARIVGTFVRNRFPTDVVLTVSRSSFAHLLCAGGLRVITVLESWDHPVKWPVGHLSDAVYVWNEDLAEDWRCYQGDADVVPTYPLKLRYWLARNLPVRALGPGRRAMYAAGTSSLSYINRLHEHELRLIEAICEATQRAGWQLLIKPKPNGKVGDFDEFARRFPHVTIGAYREAELSTDYYLDDEYNRLRECEVAGADLVINSVTTFGLDAALCGAPCLQLDVRECPEFRGVAEGQTNHHLARYFLSDPGLCLVAKSGELVDTLAAYLRAPDGRAERFSQHLRAWLEPRHSLGASVGLIADRVIAAGKGVTAGEPAAGRHALEE